MTHSARAVRLAALATGVAAIFAAGGAQAMTSDLSSLMMLYPQSHEAWAVYAYDPGNGTWMAFDDVNYQVAATVSHSGYVIEATAPEATSASTYRVVIDVMGVSVELFITPTQTQTLAAGQTATLRINNLF
jgi:hypothetical protein